LGEDKPVDPNGGHRLGQLQKQVNHISQGDWGGRFEVDDREGREEG